MSRETVSDVLVQVWHRISKTAVVVAAAVVVVLRVLLPIIFGLQRIRRLFVVANYHVLAPFNRVMFVI